MIRATLAAALLLALTPGVARPCTVTGAQWCIDTGNDATSAPLGLTSAGIPLTAVVSGGTLIFLDAETGATVIETTVTTTTTISGNPIPMWFDDGTVGVFLTDYEGYVYRVDSDGSCRWRTYTGRTDSASEVIHGACDAPRIDHNCKNDQLLASAAIQGSAPNSLVYVGTNYQVTNKTCSEGASTRNRIYALDAASGAPMWVFNAPGVGNYTNADGGHEVAQISSAVFPDVWPDACGEDRDQIVFGTLSIDLQPSFWVLDAAAGSLLQSGTFGSVTAMPVVSYNAATCGRVYLASSGTKTIKAIGITATACGAAAVPCEIWSVGSGQAVTNDLAVRHYSDPAVYYVANGAVRRLVDSGTTASACAVGSGVQSRPIVSQGFVYGGTGVGAITRLTSLCPGTASSMTFSASTVTKTGDPTFDTDFETGIGWVIIGDKAGRIVRFNVPW